MSKQRSCLAATMALLGAIVLYQGRIRPWMFTWGADDDEVTTVLAGDSFVAAGTPTTTRALSIDAPADLVWPWLAQMGEDRGGFYSYSWLERAAGAHVHNADTIHPEWQDIAVGDTIWLARRYGDAGRQVVAAGRPGSLLVLVSPDDFGRVQRGEKASGAWSFYLSQENGWTRLLVRGSGCAVGHAGFDATHFVMEQKMMRGIRRRAEQARRDRTTALVEKERLTMCDQDRPASARSSLSLARIR